MSSILLYAALTILHNSYSLCWLMGVFHTFICSDYTSQFILYHTTHTLGWCWWVSSILLSCSKYSSKFLLSYHSHCFGWLVSSILLYALTILHNLYSHCFGWWVSSILLYVLTILHSFYYHTTHTVGWCWWVSSILLYALTILHSFYSHTTHTVGWLMAVFHTFICCSNHSSQFILLSATKPLYSS